MTASPSTLCDSLRPLRPADWNHAGTSWAVEGAQHQLERSLAGSAAETHALSQGTAHVVPAADFPAELAAASGLAGDLLDHRYYQVVHAALAADFPLQYLVLRDPAGNVAAIQPFFVLRQNLLAGMQPGTISRLAARIRKIFPHFLTLKTLMVGNPAGPAALGLVGNKTADSNAPWLTRALGEAFAAVGRRRGTGIVVFKDFPASNRQVLSNLHSPSGNAGYVRLPSMPMTALPLGEYSSFEDYMQKALSKVTRKGLRRKFRDAESHPLEMTVTHDVSDCIDEVYNLYLQVYGRARMTFEKLTPEFFLELGQKMPDRARFFLWRLAGPGKGRLVAMSATLMNTEDPGVEKALYDLYLGMEYPLALDLHLYFLTMRDVIDWSIARGIRTYYSTPLNYDAKLHFRHRLVPQDLYVRHLNGLLNPLFKRAMHFAEPTRHDKILPQFPNAHELKG